MNLLSEESYREQEIERVTALKEKFEQELDSLYDEESGEYTDEDRASELDDELYELQKELERLEFELNGIRDTIYDDYVEDRRSCRE